MQHLAYAAIAALAAGFLAAARARWLERRLRRRAHQTIRENLNRLIALRAELLGRAEPQAWRAEAERFANSQIMARLTRGERAALARRPGLIADLVARHVAEAAAFSAYYRS
jgi:hypothetical protein